MTDQEIDNLTILQLNVEVFVALGYSYWTTSNAAWDTNAGYTDWILDRDGYLKRFYFDGSRSRAGHWDVNDTYKVAEEWGWTLAEVYRNLSSENITIGPVDSNSKDQSTFVEVKGKYSHGTTLPEALCRAFLKVKNDRT